MKIGITDALLALRPNAKFLVRGNVYTGIEWKDESQSLPSEIEVGTKIIELRKEMPMKLLREKRNQLISRSDWTQLPDVPEETKTKWKIYRQALRDLPSHSEPKLNTACDRLDMTSVTWPTEPT